MINKESARPSELKAVFFKLLMAAATVCSFCKRGNLWVSNVAPTSIVHSIGFYGLVTVVASIKAMFFL